LLLLLNNKFAVCVTVSNACSSAKYDPSTAGSVKPDSTAHTVNDDSHCSNELNESKNRLSGHSTHHILS